jgi:hypothetical protein
MKTYISDGILCVLWIVLIIGANYYFTGMKNDRIDDLCGLLAGFGGIAILGILSWLRKRKVSIKTIS